MWAIVPLKPFAQAKQRLAAVLSAAQRAALMQAMLTDVLSSLRQCDWLAGILLVSREPSAAAWAERFGALLYQEAADADLSTAVQNASGLLVANQGATGTLILHADLPLCSAEELTRILHQHQQSLRDGGGHALTLVPDQAGAGTNCIVSTPPNLIRYQFNGQSFKPHLDAAYSIGVTPCIMPSTKLGLDIDKPEDLQRLLTLGAGGATARCLQELGLAQNSYIRQE